MKRIISLSLLFLFPVFLAAQTTPSGQLTAPADRDSCQLTDVTLCTYVHDADGDSLHVTFYFRPSIGAPPDFTIAGLPDTQYYTSELNNGNNEFFKSQTNWIVAHKDSLNIVHVCHLGDCVQNGDYNNDDTEWLRADTAMRIIEDPLATGLPEGISYTMNVGNHDQWPTGDANGTTTFFNQYFGVNRFNGRSYWGGNYDTTADNNFQLFSASGYDFLVVSLEYDPNANSLVLAWADSLLQAYPSRKAIIVSHYLLDATGTFGAQGMAVYAALRHNPNLFLMLCGHVTGESRRTDVYNGDTTYTLLSDYQGRANGGGGWMRYMTFSPEFNTITVKTYSSMFNQYETDTNSFFTLPRFLYPQNAYASIGFADVDSAGTACITVSGLLPDTEYDWYATIDDGTTIVRTNYSRFATFGSIVSASVSADTVCVNGAPVQLSGIPAGGIFSGNGVSGNTMSPSLAGAGTDTVLYMYVNNAGCENSVAVPVYVDPCTGIGEMQMNAISLFYSGGALIFNCDAGAGKLCLYDASGRELFCTFCSQGKNTIGFTLPAAGIYLYRFLGDDQTAGDGKILVAE